jgi:hypothetical protein
MSQIIVLKPGSKVWRFDQTATHLHQYSVFFFDWCVNIFINSFNTDKDTEMAKICLW